MNHTIMKNKTDRIIGVGGKAGDYFPVSLKREFVLPSVNFDFYVNADPLRIKDLTPNELAQYTKLLEKMPADPTQKLKAAADCVQ